MSKALLKQCPYDRATRCIMDEACPGCETWARSRRRTIELIDYSLAFLAEGDPEASEEAINELLDMRLKEVEG